MMKSFIILFFSINLAYGLTIKQELYQQVSQSHIPLYYRDAKHILYYELFIFGEGSVQDVYCERIFKASSGGINVEHSWPKSRFNKTIARDIQSTDLHHLYPVDAQANSHRGNDFFGEVDGGAIFDHCLSSKSGRIIGTAATYGFEPPDEIKGDIARAHFYFSIRYQQPIDSLQEKFFRKWSQQDPVSIEELIRNDLIESVQGNRNPFIDDNTLVQLINDF